MTGSPNRLRLSRPVELAPAKVRAHGLREAHARPLVSRGKDRRGNFSRSWRVRPSRASGWGGGLSRKPLIALYGLPGPF